MMTNNNIHSDLAIPPGEFLEEVLDGLGMTKDELARRMNRPAPKLSAIFKGEKAITPETALQLEKVVGIPAHIWTGLESEYRLTLVRNKQIKEQECLKTESKLVTKYRYAELVKLEVVSRYTKAIDKVSELHRFFAVTSLNAIPNLRRYQPAFRRSEKKLKGRTPEAISAWLRIGEVQAHKCRCASFSDHSLENSLREIRSMTRQSPDKFLPPLFKKLFESGVVLVLCPHVTGTGIQGATFWMGPQKAVVMMSLRYNWADIFWFSLFHEIGHVLMHGRNTVVLEGIESGDPKLQKQENEANEFAADFLIPPEAYRLFLADNLFYEENIRLFADQIDIDPGIVVGRLQNDKRLRREWHNSLRYRYTFRPNIN
jgi:HTH-type transcriptional regulator/antitoxin HigA